MTACWRCGVLFCNSFLIFGVFYFGQIPLGLQNEIMNSHIWRSYTREANALRNNIATRTLANEQTEWILEHTYNGTNSTSKLIDCKVCLGLGEIRYNVLFSVTKWTSVVVCLPLGFLIDRLGNSRSAILLSITSLLGSILFTVGATSQAPVTNEMYIVMVTGYGLTAFGDGPLRFVQARVVAHCFPEATFRALALISMGYSGQIISLYVTPIIAKDIGIIPAVLLGVSACGFGVACAVGLAFLLQLHTPQVAEDNQNNKILTLRELRELPRSYWLYMLAIGFIAACWNAKQDNLPDYLQLRHGYTTTEAFRITTLSPLVYLMSPLLCLALKKAECDGILTTFFIAWLVPLYALLGFCPDVNVNIICLVDGIGVCIIAVMTFQLLVILCPATYVGTLAGLLFTWRDLIIALTLVASGYILQRHKVTNKEEALCYYQHFYLMLIIMSSTAVVCGAVMNILDIRKACALNNRIGTWRQSNIEAIGLMSMIQPSNKYCGIDDVNDDTVSDDSSIKATTCNEK